MRRQHQNAHVEKPDPVNADLDMAARCIENGELRKAKEIYQALIIKKPDCVEAYCNQGIVLMGLGDYVQALICFEQALMKNPKLAATHYNLGNAQRKIGNLNEAIKAYQKAIQLKPDYINAHKNLGAILQTQGQLAAAVQHLNKALEYNKNDDQAINNLANIYKHQNQYGKAIYCYRSALAIKPNNLEAHSNLLYTLCSDTATTPEQYLAEAKLYGEKVLAFATPYDNWLTDAENSTRRGIRVGFVSGDLKSHPVGYFLESTLKYFDQKRFELVAYSARVQEDNLTKRIKPYFSAWNLIVGLSDGEAALKIYQDKIDILVDLSGHTAFNRLSLFAWKPAPVQVSWLGYFASTGLESIDYLLSDPFSIPEAKQLHYTEKIWYLPELRMCFTPPEGVVIKPLPAIENGYITFGCYQASSKINDEVLVIWGKIIRLLPNARLRLQNKQMSCLETREKLKSRLAKFGIKKSLVSLHGSNSRIEYLDSYAEVDILLDTFPYPGGTTTCEALWMGVPTLTLAGETLLSRQGASMLTAAGLSNWVADNEKEYVKKAVKLSANLTALALLRASLRARVLSSPLFDSKRFAENLEQAFMGMYESVCSSRKIQPVGVEMGKVFLHIGCGLRNKSHTTAGFNNSPWREIRLDIDDSVNPDIVGSMTNMASVEDASVDAIFSSHNIEHLYPHEVPLALKEFIRVLKPDGFLVVTCPDLQSVCTLVAEDKLTEPAYTSPAGPIAPIDILYGYRPSLEKGNYFMAHRCGFTQKVLIGTLRGGGFMTTAAISRGHPFYDLWAVSSKSELSHEAVRELAGQHFP